ncbi:uncharacterized protein M6B38_317460 [Iris pallida]|uniref:Uncharacterized protein n=1 Tax=Iris pallida TaxID=29817 RepID=A0AAX6HE84_IRIPA|nr:uncharacterized protein M6B38_317460 [Iris pallida]
MSTSSSLLLSQPLLLKKERRLPSPPQARPEDHHRVPKDRARHHIRGTARHFCLRRPGWRQLPHHRLLPQVLRQ